MFGNEYASQLSAVLIPDITKIDNFKEAVDDAVTGIIHTASPFSLDNLTDMRTQLLDPAIGGAVTIFEAAAKYGKNVRRVVTTASFASILDVSKGLRPEYMYTEADWNPVLYDQAATASPALAYSASKEIAERAQWKC